MGGLTLLKVLRSAFKKSFRSKKSLLMKRYSLEILCEVYGSMNFDVVFTFDCLCITTDEIKHVGRGGLIQK